jgi:hypothetical protein
MREPARAPDDRRYYLTRNHNLYAVSDHGEHGKKFFRLETEEPGQFGLDPRENLFSGVH